MFSDMLPSIARHRNAPLKIYYCFSVMIIAASCTASHGGDATATVGLQEAYEEIPGRYAVSRKLPWTSPVDMSGLSEPSDDSFEEEADEDLKGSQQVVFRPLFRHRQIVAEREERRRKRIILRKQYPGQSRPATPRPTTNTRLVYRLNTRPGNKPNTRPLPNTGPLAYRLVSKRPASNVYTRPITNTGARPLTNTKQRPFTYPSRPLRDTNIRPLTAYKSTPIRRPHKQTYAYYNPRYYYVIRRKQ